MKRKTRKMNDGTKAKEGREGRGEEMEGREAWHGRRAVQRNGMESHASTHAQCRGVLYVFVIALRAISYTI